MWDRLPRTHCAFRVLALKRNGWLSILLLKWLRDAVSPPGSTGAPDAGRGCAPRSSSPACHPSRMGQHAAIGTATGRRAATRPNGAHQVPWSTKTPLSG